MPASRLLGLHTAKMYRLAKKTQFKKDSEILYAVTGWDKETLKLTQEAAKSSVVDALKPNYILQDIMDLL